jgi:hypothetical protein
MGFNIVSFRHFHGLLERLGIDRKKSVVIEFGAQQNWYSSSIFPKASYFQLNFKDTYKEIHTFDIRKEHDQVEQVDLRNELVLPYKADIITDMGTAEHIEGEKGLYTFFKNYHNACKKGGLMIHCIPEKGSYVGHPDAFFWFTKGFFEKLAKANNYKVLELESIGVNLGHMNVWCAMIKEEDKEFMSYDDFWRIWE